MDTRDLLSPMREESKKSKQRMDKKRRPTVVEAEADSVYDDYDVPTPSTPPPPPPPDDYDDENEGVAAKTASSIPLVQTPNKNTSPNRLGADSNAPLGDTAGTTSKTEGEEKGIVTAPLSASSDASDSPKTSKKSSSSSRAKAGSRASSSKSKRATESALSLDAAPPSPPQSEPDQAPISEETKRSNQRLMILKEIFNSEKDYVDQVRDTIETFLIPLRAANFADNISREIPVIFGNIELIQSVNSSLLQRLDERASVVEIDAGNDPNVSSFAFTVGDIFLEMSNNLLCYDQYCTNHKKSVEALQRAEKHQIFKEELEKCRNRNVMRGRLQHLNDLLIKPIQRICKYPLLFKELLKVTPESHPDFRPLEEALHRLGEIALQINESNAIAENVQKLEDLQKRIDGLDFRLAEPPRHFVLEGDLQKVNPRGKVQTRYFLLMSDMLIWTAAKPMKKNHYQFKGQLRLDLAVVRDTPDTEKIRNKFEIIKLDTKKIYVLVAESPELKKKWMAAIEVIINSYLEAEKIKDKQIQIQMARMGNSPRTKPGSSPVVSRDQPTRFSPISKATSVSSHEVSALVRQSLAPSAPSSSSAASPASSPLLSAVVAPGSPLRPDVQSTSSSGGAATDSSDFENYDDQQQRQHQDDRIIAEMAVQIDVLLKGFREMQNLLSQSQQAQQALEERVAVLEKVIDKQQQKKKQSRKTSDPIPPKQ